MFCFKCGAEVPDESAFCFKCGQDLSILYSHQKSSTSEFVAEISNQEDEDNLLDRNAMQIYLNDLLYLENLERSLEENIKNVNGDLEGLKLRGIDYRKTYLINRSLKYNEALNSGGITFAYLNQKFYIAKWGSRIYIDKPETYDLPNQAKFLAESKKLQDEQLAEIENEDAINYFTDKFLDLGRFKKELKRNETIDVIKEKFRLFQKDVVEPIQSWNEEIIGLESKLSNLENLKHQTKSKLQQFYNLNFLPSQYRNIESVYYLNDFLKTSQLSFNDALYHLDFNEIKDRMDSIIEQNQQNLINQAILTSQNKVLLRQNSDLLKKLANIERNTQKIALYEALNNLDTDTWALFELADVFLR